MRLTFLLFVAVLAVPHAGLATESDPLDLAGSRVRLVATDRSTAADQHVSGAAKQVGTVVEVRGDTLLFKAENQSTPVPITTSSLTGLEVSQGSEGHALTGAGIGFLVGAGTGALLAVLKYGSEGYTSGSDTYSTGLVALVWAGMGGAVGLVTGGVIGATHRTERWEPLTTSRVRVSAGPAGRGSLALALSVRI